jgi:hypothetical protein
MGTQIGIEKMVEQVCRTVRHTGRVTSDIVASRWKGFHKQLTSSDVEQLARDGLVYRVNNALHVERDPKRFLAESATGAVTVVTHTPLSSDYASSILVDVTYVTIGGTVKPLLHFTIEDGQYVAHNAHRKAAGWTAIGQFMDHLVGCLVSQKAQTVADLSETIQRSLCERYEKMAHVVEEV